MERALVAVVIAVVAVAVALVLRRGRRTDAPTSGTSTLPTQLDRHDFADPDRPWLAVLFSSATCASCADARAELLRLADPDVALDEVEASQRRTIHERYGIDAVPAIVIADASGVVRATALGPPPAGHLKVELARIREE